MNDRNDVARDHDGLTAELRELGAALRAAPVPALGEAAARGLFRAHGAARRAPRRRAPVWASAAALAVSIVTGAWVVLTREAPVEVVANVEVDAAASAAAAPPPVFQPLLYAPVMSPTRSYNVVRVRIPLASLAVGPAAELDGWVEADVLVGEDGLASGIRFDPDNTLLISSASR